MTLGKIVTEFSYYMDQGGFVMWPLVGATLVDATDVVWRLRQVKTPYEQEVMRRSGKVSSNAHRAAMRATRPGRHEYEVEAELEKKEIERQIVTRLEKLLYQIDGVEYVYSMSRPGMAVVTVRFFVGEDRVARVIGAFPTPTGGPTARSAASTARIASSSET